MNIYISGLEFPKVPTVIILLPDGKVEIPSQARIEKAMPVSEHGRLIDADAFVRFIKSAIERQSYGELKLKKGLTVKDVLDAVIADLEGSGVDGFANAPTIIPASGGKENE